jgi:hypothetical protein
LKNFTLGLVLGGLIALGITHLIHGRHSSRAFNTPFQAVLLDDNQVFYGKLSGLDGNYPILDEVFYIKTGVDPQSKETKSVLVKRGKELHSPDRMYLNSRHIVLIEPVGASSQVAKLIEQAKTE